MSKVSRVRCGSKALCAAFLLLVGTTVHAGESTTTPAVSVNSFTAPDGQVYTAIAIKPDISRTTTLAMNMVLIVDTSASQAGEYRTKSIEFVKGVLSTLGKDDRTMLVALDVVPQNLTDGFVAVGSEQIKVASRDRILRPLSRRLSV